VETPPGLDLPDTGPLERVRDGNNSPGKYGHLTNRGARRTPDRKVAEEVAKTGFIVDAAEDRREDPGFL